MKSTLSATIVMSLLLQPFAHAQPDTAVVAPIIAGGRGTAYIGGPGTYKQVNEEVTKLGEQALNVAQVTQKEDLEYVRNALADIQASYEDYSETVINGEILKLETVGISGNTVRLDDFMRATAELKQKRSVFEGLLLKYESINKETLPSNYSVSVTTEGLSQAVPSTGKVDLNKPVAKYKELIGQIDSRLSSYKNIKVEIYGQVITFADYKSILEPDFSMVPSLAVDKRAELTKKADKLREDSRQVGQENRVEFTNILRNDYNQFMKMYGADYKYVPRTSDSGGIVSTVMGWIWGNGETRSETGRGDSVAVQGVEIPDDMKMRNNSFKRLLDVFWMRSYLRLSQGIRICALQHKEVPPSNLGALKAIEGMKELRTQPACSRTELEAALQNSRNVIIYSGMQSEKVFKRDNFLNDGLLTRIGSSYTFLRGNRPSAEALHMLAQLVYADIQEELMMATPGRGLQDLYELYRTRYQASADQKLYYQEVKCSVDRSAKGCSNSSAFAENPGVGLDGDPSKVFIDLQQEIKLAKDYIEQANRILTSLDAARKDEQGFKKANERAEQL